jgi:hypothetical protein
MKIVIKSHDCQSDIETTSSLVGVAMDRHEQLTIQLGINLVTVSYRDGIWQITSNLNVKINHQKPNLGNTTDGR